jgi:hypothetical protein
MVDTQNLKFVKSAILLKQEPLARKLSVPYMSASTYSSQHRPILLLEGVFSNELHTPNHETGIAIIFLLSFLQHYSAMRVL